VLTLPAAPTVEDLLSDPTQARILPIPALQAMLCRCVNLQAALLGALLAAGASRSEASSERDILIGVDRAAERLGVSKDWLYHRAHQLPFTVRQGRLLRFSTDGIARYIRSRQGR